MLWFMKVNMNTEIQPYITADKLHRPQKGEKASNIDIMSGPYNG